MQKKLKGKAIIVTGAGTKGEGIGNGQAAAVQFGREGANVLCVDRDEVAAYNTVNMIRKEGGSAEVCTADVLIHDDCRRVVQTCIECFKKIDVLHNNVGVISGKEIIDTTDKEWAGTFGVNVNGMFYMCRETIPKMVEAGRGCIINVSSIVSHRPLSDAAYVSSKGAVDSMTLYIASRYGRYNIRANVLLLGYIDTPLARPIWNNEKVKQINLKQVPMRRFASPWEVATVATFLASDDSSYVNGVILPVDGGLLVSL